MSPQVTSMHVNGLPAASPLASTSAAALVAAPQQQAPEQIPGGGAAAGGGLVIVVVLGFLLHRAIEKKKAHWPHVIMAFSMGVLLSASMLGVMAKQVTTSVGQGMATMFSTVAGSDSGR